MISQSTSKLITGNNQDYNGLKNYLGLWGKASKLSNQSLVINRNCVDIDSVTNIANKQMQNSILNGSESPFIINKNYQVFSNIKDIPVRDINSKVKSINELDLIKMVLQQKEIKSTWKSNEMEPNFGNDRNNQRTRHSVDSWHPKYSYILKLPEDLQKQWRI